MSKPKRVTLSRERGWRMPVNTVKVDRGTGFGNPWKIGEWSATLGRKMSREDAVLRFQQEVEDGNWQYLKAHAKELLKGKNLACWCKLTDEKGNYVPCHADILLAIANDMTLEEVKENNLK